MPTVTLTPAQRRALEVLGHADATYRLAFTARRTGGLGVHASAARSLVTLGLAEVGVSERWPGHWGTIYAITPAGRALLEESR